MSAVPKSPSNPSAAAVLDSREQKRERLLRVKRSFRSRQVTTEILAARVGLTRATFSRVINGDPQTQLSTIVACLATMEPQEIEDLGFWPVWEKVRGRPRARLEQAIAATQLAGGEVECRLPESQPESSDEAE